VTELLPACLQCNSNFQDEPGSPMIPRITLGDGRWVCAQCVDACTRGIARWRARRAKEQEEVEKERERRAAEERWRAEHTALLGRPKPRSDPYALSERQMVIVRKAMLRVPEKQRPEFLRMIHDEAREYVAGHFTKQVDDNFLRQTIEIAVVALT
jgi:YesN/AraC family two-component response regulator